VSLVRRRDALVAPSEKERSQTVGEGRRSGGSETNGRAGWPTASSNESADGAAPCPWSPKSAPTKEVDYSEGKGRGRKEWRRRDARELTGSPRCVSAPAKSGPWTICAREAAAKRRRREGTGAGGGRDYGSAECGG
jgi:hypothetical protein